MAFWNRKEETRAEEKQVEVVDPLLSAIVNGEEIDVEKALKVPSYSSSLDMIAETVAMAEVKLYKEEIVDGVKKVIEIKNDNRVKLLNDDTGDTLDGNQFKKAIVRDYLNKGAGYIYINKGTRNKIKSLHYVDYDNVTTTHGVDPIFKTNEIHVNGIVYDDFQFIKVLRNTKDGVSGIGLVKESNDILNTAYSTMIYEKSLVRTGGNKKGFLKSPRKLSQQALDSLKEAWRRLYSNNEENVIVLNDGLEFQESSNTFVEMQMAENKKNLNQEIRSLFKIPVNGSYQEFIKKSVTPIFNAIETALNKDLLLEKEKGIYYFAFDSKDLMKGDIEARYNAYTTAVNAGWITKNEVRYLEDFEEIEGLDVVSFNLGDVLYDVKSQTYYTPNTNSQVELGEGNKDEKVQDSKEKKQAKIDAQVQERKESKTSTEGGE